MEPEIILERSGLTKAESKIYVSLLKLGTSRAGTIIKHTGLQSSVVHNGINALLEKGFVSYVFSGSIREYTAINPLAIEQHLESVKEEFHQNLSVLISIQKTTKPASAEIFVGFQGILNAMLLMVNDAKTGDVFKYFAASEEVLSEKAIDFFSRADMIRKSSGVKLKGIARIDNKALENYSASEIRFTTHAIPPAMNLFKDKILIIALSSKPTAVLINSKELAAQYHNLWDEIWKKSKK